MSASPNTSNSNNWYNVNNDGSDNNNNTNNNNGVAPELCVRWIPKIMQNGTNITNSDVSYSNKVSDTMNAIFSFENLYRAYEKCTLGVKWKWSTQNYMVNACCRIARLNKRILNAAYKSPPPRCFPINERGKKRNITALGFEDRVVNRCLCDRYLNPILQKSLIHDNGATIKGKGLSFTKNRTICHLQKYYRHYGNKGYVLKMDIHHYFESIDHDILTDKMRKNVHDRHLLTFVRQLMDTCDKGLGLGSQVSQIGAVYYLNSVDHYIKEKFHCKYYGRYMDDMYIISNNKERLKSILKIVIKLLEPLKLKLNLTKSRIYDLDKGFVFCKTRYVLTKSGKVLKLLTSNSMASMKRKVKKGIDIANIYPSFESYIKSFNTYKKLYYFKQTYIIKPSEVQI